MVIFAGLGMDWQAKRTIEKEVHNSKSFTLDLIV